MGLDLRPLEPRRTRLHTCTRTSYLSAISRTCMHSISYLSACCLCCLSDSLSVCAPVEPAIKSLFQEQQLRDVITADRFAGVMLGVMLAVTAGWARPQSMVLPSLLCSGNFNEILSCRCSRGLGDEDTRDVGRRPQ